MTRWISPLIIGASYVTVVIVYLVTVVWPSPVGLLLPLCVGLWLAIVLLGFDRGEVTGILTLLAAPFLLYAIVAFLNICSDPSAFSMMRLASSLV